MTGPVRRAVLFVTCAIVVAIFASGCSTTGGTQVRSYGPDAVQEDCRILANHLSVTHYDADEVNGLLRVQVTALNESRRSIQFEYRYRWMNAQGFEVGTPTSTWMPVVAEPKDEVHMQGLAPDSSVTDFVFDVRFSDAL